MGRHENEHLRRFLAARGRRDAAGMRRWWDEIVIDFFDRMDGFVAASHKGRLNEEEHDVAVQLSMARFSERLIDSYEGVSMGELVNASKTLARGICMDVQRASVRAKKHGAVSLDDGWNADREDRLTPSWEADEAACRFDRRERDADARDFRQWALPQLPPDRRRVLEMTVDGATVQEIMDELGISRDNAYQLRSRGLRDLERLKEQWDA